MRLAPDSIDPIADRSDVVSIQPYFQRKKLDERQDQIIAGNLTGTAPSSPGYLAWLASKGFTQAQFALSDFVVDLTDSGLDNGTVLPNHPGLYLTGVLGAGARVAYNRLEGDPNGGSTLKGCDGHGTLNGHIIAGYDDFPAGFPHTDAAGYHYGLGVCPFVKVGSSVIFDPDDFTFPDYTDLISRAYHNQARISSNSWGSDEDGAYDSDAQEYDRLVRDAEPAGAPFSAAGNQEMVIVFAAGNAGPSSATMDSPGSAKNVITVGASENVQPLGQSDGCGYGDSSANNSGDIASYSGREPCKDGRHKPEIVAPGTHITGGVAQVLNPGMNGSADTCFSATGVCGLNSGHFFPAGQELFTISTGTSHSTPCVAGGCALIRQYFLNTYATAPSAAMTKAFLVNSARFLAGSGAGSSLWSDSQGMGEMNLGTAFDGVRRMLRDQNPADLFTSSGQARTFTGAVSDASKPFRVTLAWTDAPGSTVGNAYRNNLDLTVSINGKLYKGNVFSGAYSTTNGVADARNNLESVFLPVGTTGSFTVTVNAININSDGVPNNGIALDQDFALVIYNGDNPLPPGAGQIQPTNAVALAGAPFTFTVPFAGSPPLRFQWSFNGASIPGATNAVYAIASATPAAQGTYSVSITNNFGSTNRSGGVLTVIPNVPLPVALDSTNLSWQTDSNMPWYGQTLVSHDGSSAAQSWPLTDGQHGSMQTVVTGPGKLSFWWRVSSETNGDILRLTIDGEDQEQISGEVPWEIRHAYLAAGVHSIGWTYSKDDSGAAGQDRAWVDEVDYGPGGTAPLINVQPQSQASMGSAPASFTVQAEGTPALSYQWFFNGLPIPGATNDLFLIPAPQAADNGIYSVVVSNGLGVATSEPAFFGIVPFWFGGDNSFGQANPAVMAANAIALSAGSWHTLSLQADGSVAAWGNNSDGQCTVPPHLGFTISVAAGGYHSLALGLDGMVRAWGANYNGQASPPPGLSNVTAVAAGAWHSLALRENGKVVAWGDNSSGQCDVPSGLSNVVAIAAGGSHNLALRGDGSVVAWGENTDAQGAFAGQSVVPGGLTNIVGIAAGEYHSLCLRADKSIVAWGDNSMGQCQTPAALTNIAMVAGGGMHSVAVGFDGRAYAWGSDLNGQCELPSGLTNVTCACAGNQQTILMLGALAPQPFLRYSQRLPSRFQTVIETLPGRAYQLEYRDSLSSGWSARPSFRGRGGYEILRDPNASDTNRFYRVKQF